MTWTDVFMLLTVVGAVGIIAFLLIERAVNIRRNGREDERTQSMTKDPPVKVKKTKKLRSGGTGRPPPSPPPPPPPPGG